jgi:glutamate-1-semialdehyde 2,1-aminomutase
MYEKSQALFAEAGRVIPGGVNSPVRAFKSLTHQPLFIERGEGSRIYDADGNSYLDFVGSWGPLILGHAHPHIVETICKTAAKGTSFGAPTALETEMACLIVEAVPSVELVRMVNSGTEAVMSALRVARGYTNRSKVIKFIGCYHGHGDSFLIRAGSGAATLGCPDSPGVTEGTARDTICLPYNDLPAVKKVFAVSGEEIAAVVVEPVAGNMGLVMPEPGYLEGLREITRAYGSLLIFDEVITGFRVSYGGAQEYFNIDPDLTTLGKIIGGGMPVGAYGGKREIMEQVAPCGPVYQAGTLSGNPLAMAVGIETLKILKTPGFYEGLSAKREKLISGIAEAAEAQGVKIQQSGIGSIFGMFFNAEAVTDFESAKTSDQESFKVFFKALLKEGVYIAPSQFESGFVSAAHSELDISVTIAAMEKAFSAVRELLQSGPGQAEMIS